MPQESESVEVIDPLTGDSTVEHNDPNDENIEPPADMNPEPDSSPEAKNVLCDDESALQKVLDVDRYAIVRAEADGIQLAAQEARVQQLADDVQSNGEVNNQIDSEVEDLGAVEEMTEVE